MKQRLLTAVCALLAAGGTSVLAQQAFIPAPSGVRLAERWRPTGAKGDGRIIGIVVDVYQDPVAYAKVRLRNLLTSEVEQETTADEKGAYEFKVDSGTYVVEMLTVDRYILALSNAMAVGRTDTLQASVHLAGRWDATNSRVVPLQNFGNYFGMSSQSTMTAATLALAVDLNITASDPGEPVSP